MKQGIVISISLVLVFLVCVPLAAQPSTRSIETIVIDSFDNETLNVSKPVSGDKTADTAKVQVKWTSGASKFVEEGFPQVKYVDGIPNALRAVRDPEAPAPKVLGVEVAFQRKGDNWFEVYPAPSEGSEGTGGRANTEIPLTGTVKQLDFWVWGGNYRYTLEVLVRDANGGVHILPAGNLAFYGWKNVVINIPTWIPQKSRLRSGPESMNFVGFRVRSDPTEAVDNFVIYFDQLKYSTSVLSNIFDGYELRKFDQQTAASGGAN
ncbi:MAG: flagellar filament outer layer protein FlaA [Treponemataceae bacterium]|nr:MAG: flagellar filament outer layer protein FlaA [Treponemataceae bacterium]